MANAAPQNPFLYILMRDDMDSLNAGKAVSQGAHAANQMVHEIGKSKNTDHKKLLKQWQQAAVGFGPTITLATHNGGKEPINEQTLTSIVEFAQKAGFAAGITHDPSYPVQDGQMRHYIPLNTCAYVMGDKDALKPLMAQFGLKP